MSKRQQSLLGSTVEVYRELQHKESLMGANVDSCDLHLRRTISGPLRKETAQYEEHTANRSKQTSRLKISLTSNVEKKDLRTRNTGGPGPAHGTQEKLCLGLRT